MFFSDPSRSQLLSLWEAGIPLDLAWTEFAVFFDSFALRALGTHPANDLDVLSHHPRYVELTKGWLPTTWEGRQKKLEITTRAERLHLLGEIYAGRLWAIGFRTLSSGSDEPVRVPRQHFSIDESGANERGPHIHWGRGELSIGGATYFNIHVAPAPETRPDLSVSTATKQRGSRFKLRAERGKAKRSLTRTAVLPKKMTRKNTGGRHNTSRQIGLTFRRLQKQQPELRNLPIKVLVGHVRAAILGEGKRDAEEKGYKSSSMSKTIGAELSALRKRTKRNKPSKP